MTLMLIGVADGEITPPSTNLLDNPELAADYSSFGCSMYEGAAWSGADNWHEVSMYMQDYSYTFNYTEGYIDGSNVDTNWQSYSQGHGGQVVDIDFARAVDRTTGFETWTTRYSINGTMYASVTTVVTDNGADIYSYNAGTNTTTHEGHLAPGVFKPSMD